MPSDADLSVRRATHDDTDALASLYLSAREAAHPAIPRSVHPPDDTRRWLHSRLDAPGTELWLAEEAGDPVGLLLLEDAWVHSLYVAPEHAGQGVGTVLLDLAKSLRPTGLGLWVFETNDRARRFYERHGFGEVRRTDGSDNEEHQPDIEMAWPDPHSLEAMRRRVDLVDDQIAGLLAERARLTARIQLVKEVPGHAGRDAEREALIVTRMARLAPELGVERLRRIMHVVISESLDAAEASRAPGAEDQHGPDQPHPGGDP